MFPTSSGRAAAWIPSFMALVISISASLRIRYYQNRDISQTLTITDSCLGTLGTQESQIGLYQNVIQYIPPKHHDVSSCSLWKWTCRGSPFFWRSHITNQLLSAGPPWSVSCSSISGPGGGDLWQGPTLPKWMPSATGCPGVMFGIVWACLSCSSPCQNYIEPMFSVDWPMLWQLVHCMSGIPSLNPLWVDSLYLIFEICFAKWKDVGLFEVALDHLGSRVGPKSLKWVLGHFGSVRTGYMESKLGPGWARHRYKMGTNGYKQLNRISHPLRHCPKQTNLTIGFLGASWNFIKSVSRTPFIETWPEKRYT